MHIVIGFGAYAFVVEEEYINYLNVGTDGVIATVEIKDTCGPFSYWLGNFVSHRTEDSWYDGIQRLMYNKGLWKRTIYTSEVPIKIVVR